MKHLSLASLTHTTRVEVPGLATIGVAAQWAREDLAAAHDKLLQTLVLLSLPRSR